MAVEELLIDADGHILEPPDLWEKNLESKYRDRAIRIPTESGDDESASIWNSTTSFPP